MRLYGGTTVECTDGSWGEVADLVMDPFHHRLTHLVVENPERDHGSRLVPAEVVSAYVDQDADNDVEKVVLSWSTAEVLAAPNVQGAGFLDRDSWPETGKRWHVSLNRMLPWPRCAEPLGGEGVRRVAVVSSDYQFVGHVEGLVVGEGPAVSHLILDRGRLWSFQELTIPVSEIRSMSADRVLLRMSHRAVEALPSARSHRDCPIRAGGTDQPTS